MGVIDLGEARFPYERRLEELLRAYRDAQKQLSKQIAVAIAAGQFDLVFERRRQFEEVRRLLTSLGFDTDPLAVSIVRHAYQESVDRTGELIVAAGIDNPISGAFTGVAEEAVQALQDSMLGKLTVTRETVGRQVEDVFARAGRRQVMLGLLGADGNRRKVSRHLVQALTEQGKTGFTDRAGKRWALDTYAEMVARTTTREAVVEGAKARMLSQDITVARVSMHAGSCLICKPWEGRLVSLDGATSEVNGEPVATLDALPNGGPPFHPRCGHTLWPEAVRIEALRRELVA